MVLELFIPCFHSCIMNFSKWASVSLSPGFLNLSLGLNNHESLSLWSLISCFKVQIWFTYCIFSISETNQSAWTLKNYLTSEHLKTCLPISGNETYLNTCYIILLQVHFPALYVKKKIALLNQFYLRNANGIKMHQ